MPGSKPTVLFLCADNSTRSQLAESLLRHRAGEQFDVLSAGLTPRPIPPQVADVLREAGIDPVGLESKRLGPLLGSRRVRWAILLGEPGEEGSPRLFPFATQTIRWPIRDPLAEAADDDGRRERIRDAREQIDDHVRAWLADVEASGQTLRRVG
jgi:arsenate reductase